MGYAQQINSNNQTKQKKWASHEKQISNTPVQDNLALLHLQVLYHILLHPKVNPA